MTEEEVVNARGEEISKDSDDHRKIKAEHCNGVAKEQEQEQDENGNVGGKVDGGIKAVADSGASDPIVTVDGNGVASEDGKANGGEPVVTVTEGEGECEVISNNKENDCTDSCEGSNGSVEETRETVTVDVVEREGELGSVGGQNGLASAAVSGDEKDVADTVAEGGDELKSVQNGVTDREHNQCAVENESGDDVTDSSMEDGVKAGSSDVQNGVAAEGENCGEVDVNKDVADVDKGDRELEGVAVQNGVVDRAEEMEIPVVAEGVTGTATTDVVETVDSDVQGASESVSDKDHKSVESENVVGADVSDEKHIGADAIHHEVQFESVVGAAEVSECSENKEIPVDVDGVCDVKESAGEDVQNGLEKVPFESVSDADVDRSLVGAGVQNGLAKVEVSEFAQENKIPDDGGELERSGEGSGHEVVLEGENLSEALNSADVIGDGDAVSEVNGNAVESEGEPSVDKCEMKNNAVENEAEPSNKGESSDVPEIRNNAVGSVAEPSNNAVENEAEQSNNAVKVESVDVPEIRNDAVESEAEQTNNAVEGESVDLPEIRNDTMDGEAEQTNNAVEGEPVYLPEMRNDVVENEATERSKNAVEGESVDVPETRNDAVESEAERSSNHNAVEGESVDLPEMRNDAAESEAEPSNNAVESGADPSVDMPDLKTNAVESEAEPSVEGELNNAVESDAERSNNALQSEADPSVDTRDLKTDAVESEAEPSVEGEGSNHADEDSRPAQEGSAADAVDGQITEVVKRPFYYLIRIPRYDDDENIKEQIQNAFRQVEEKTKIRDAIRSETPTKKASCKVYGQEVRAAISAERAARDLFKSKRQEMDSVQSTMNRLNNAISVGDIDGKIRNMEHMIEHETLPLKEEKQLIRQIKQLRQNRDELSTAMAKQDQSHQSLDHKDSIEEHSKQLHLLKKELESLRTNVQKTEGATKSARKKYDEECNQLSELLARFKAADDVRQEAYAKLQALKKQLHEKGKYFWEYKNAANKGQELAAEGKKEELQSFCIDQAERIMELWNNNDEFRRDYVRCNTRSTLRRLQTHDGRSLGPDEEPPIIPNTFTERASKIDSLVSQSTLEQEKKSISTEPVNVKDEPVSKVVVQKTERTQTTTNAKKPAKPAPLEKLVPAVPRWGDESDEDTREEPVRTKEEEERILKAEKARKEEEAAKLKEKKRLEEIEKAKEALQRKKRNAEKAQQRAAFKAQKEAEQKEKEREKRTRKKERRKAADAASDNAEQEAAPSSETPTRTTEEFDQSEKPVEVTKRSQKPSQFTKQTKVKSLPMSIRNRGKRRIQPWMWVLIVVLAVVALFYMGNNSFLISWLQSFGF